MLNGIKLFISHSAADIELAVRLIDLLRAALNLSAKEIRCTSVDGHRLPACADTDEQLRREVYEAEAFIGIVSAASLRSLYVLFELAARWGAQKHLVPLLSPGVTPAALGGPVSGLNSLRADSRAQLHQLVTELGHVLKIDPEGGSSSNVVDLPAYVLIVVARSRRARQSRCAADGSLQRRHDAERVYAGARRIAPRGRRQGRRRIDHDCSQNREGELGDRSVSC
jgi:hypothetical protein